MQSPNAFGVFCPLPQDHPQFQRLIELMNSNSNSYAMLSRPEIFCTPAMAPSTYSKYSRSFSLGQTKVYKHRVVCIACVSMRRKRSVQIRFITFLLAKLSIYCSCFKMPCLLDTVAYVLRAWKHDAVLHLLLNQCMLPHPLTTR